ncbi:MAG: Arylsulfatase [Verrucomicrobiota bacterium]
MPDFKIPCPRALLLPLLLLLPTALALAASSSPNPTPAPATARPNLLLILCDDLGYADLSCYGAKKIFTPHLDRLAAGGVRFTDAHTPSSVCTPTRYGLLTGRYAWRTWMKNGVLDGFDPPLIEQNRTTLASYLRAQGYATAAIGKWHLGMTWTKTDGQPVAFRGTAAGDARGPHRGDVGADFSRDTRGGPLDVGFDSFFGISASLDMPPYVYLEGRRATAIPTASAPNQKTLVLNQSPGPVADGFVLENVLGDLTKRAVQFIDSRANQPAPFFLYLPLTSPHLPVVPAKEFIGKSGAGIYGDFVVETDARVGELLAALDRAKLSDNTLVIFTSDNGGLWHAWKPEERDDLAGYQPTPRAKANAALGHHSNGTLRGTKADVWEGGHRVPFIVRWPARVPRGVTSTALVELNDTLATVATIVGAPLPRDAGEDSISFLPALLDARGATSPRTFAVHHTITGEFALRDGPWKFAPQRGSGGFSNPKQVKPAAGESPAQLYNLAADPHETRNLADTEKSTAARLANRLTEIRASPRTAP